MPCLIYLVSVLVPDQLDLALPLATHQNNPPPLAASRFIRFAAVALFTRSGLCCLIIVALRSCLRHNLLEGPLW